MDERVQRYVCALGLFLALLGLFVVTSGGRLDVGDGLSRHDVARSWLERGHPQVTDTWVKLYWGVPNERTGTTYSMYNAAGSITPIPLMLLSRALPGHTAERDRFAFTMIGPIAGALGGALLLLALCSLGLRPPAATLWAGLMCLTTLWWPGCLTVFDQSQHALVIFVALFLAWQAGRRSSLKLALAGGLVGGLVLSYQEFYALVLPAIALAVFASPEEGGASDGLTLQREPDRNAVRRYFAFGIGCLLGVGLFVAYNYLRFGTPTAVQRYKEWPTGDVLEAFVSLAVSPGKGVLWFSPLLVLAVIGMRSFYGRAPALASAIAISSLIYLGVVSSQPFYGGDPCWGPRYAVAVLPMWALAIPFGAARLRRPAPIVVVLAGVGLAVQLLGISLDAQAFYENRTKEVFLSGRRWVHFRQSILLARPADLRLAFSRTAGQPYRAATSYRGATYCSFHFGDFDYADQPGKLFTILDLPRPWPFWVGRVPLPQRPVEPAGLLLFCGLCSATGVGLMVRALSRPRVRVPELAPAV
jgi:hypothetical protein